MIEISAKRFSSSPCSPDTILKLLQMSETQKMIDKKETITTFRIPSTLSHSKSPQSPTAYTFLSQILSINDTFPFPSRIFFIHCCSSLCCWLVIYNPIVTCQVLISSNHCPNLLSCILDVIYLSISDLIPSILICNQRYIYLSPSLVHYWFQSSSYLFLSRYI